MTTKDVLREEMKRHGDPRTEDQLNAVIIRMTWVERFTLYGDLRAGIAPSGKTA